MAYYKILIKIREMGKQKTKSRTKNSSSEHKTTINVVAINPIITIIILNINDINIAIKGLRLSQWINKHNLSKCCV